ncbi:ATP-binding cassette domain-containing protein [Glycomyces salinus]|uniref:ATP-binding cassette domain-containing protein n=1 Tax=Glycomyces salinus TaxID=980294 RepID=UPI0018EDDA62|nr:ATP-binding cassette domain-containing protein [Glycomyces salinus]
MTLAFQARGLVKRFGATTALDGVDLSAEEGTVLGVLGPNGAGKTTAVRILATLLRPDSGTATVGGLDVARHPGEVRRLIGLTGQFASVDADLTGTQNLVLIGRLLDMRGAEAKARARELLADFDLSEAAGRAAGTYSGGMRRRLDLAASLMGRPKIVFLDEPTTGLDPAKREELWGVVRRLVDDGATVLLTTQYLEEADALADEISVIDSGEVIAHGTPADLKRIVGGRHITVRPADPARLDDAGRVLSTVTGRSPDSPHRGVLSVPAETDRDFPAVVAELDRAGVPVTELALQLPDLDDVFFKLTGHTAADDKEAVAA